jgi:2-polyprenyl-6-methoxyphenol hydroxylase-like FAD-dependent oxidoreductase
MNHIAIIGAGIGGLTLANALARKRIRATIYERAPELAEVGAGIWIPPNAMQIFERLGLDKELEEHSLSISALEVLNPQGERLNRVSLEKMRQTYGYGLQSIHRARFQKILAQAFGEKNIHFQKELTDLNEDEGGVTLGFADGSSARADIVVGADGLRSVVRRFLFPEVEERDSGQTCFRGIGKLSLPDETICQEIWGSGHRIGYSAIAHEEVYWFAPVTRPFEVSGPEAKPQLLELYKDFPAVATQMIEATPQNSIIRTDLKDFPPLTPWYKGRCVLMGDAAHATTPNMGQGAAQAVESAYILARSLATHDKPQDAFAHYQATRIEKAHYITKLSFTFGKTSQTESGILQSLRDFAVRHTPDFLSEGQLNKIYQLGY